MAQDDPADVLLVILAGMLLCGIFLMLLRSRKGRRR